MNIHWHKVILGYNGDLPLGVWLGQELAADIVKGGNADLLESLVPELVEDFDLNMALTLVFWTAIECGRFDIAERCLSEALLPILDCDGDSLLDEAVTSPHAWGFDAIEWIAAHGADLERLGSLRMTPLFTAIRERNLRAVETLVRLGANIHALAYDEWGEVSVLMFAAEAGRKDVVDFLLEQGADLSRKDTRGRRASHRAAENGHPELARYLRLLEISDRRARPEAKRLHRRRGEVGKRTLARICETGGMGRSHLRGLEMVMLGCRMMVAQVV